MKLARPAAESPAAAIDLVAAIGRDHALAPDELGDVARDAGAATARWWALYDDCWRRFCGTRLDPQFRRLDHPATRTGGLVLAPGVPVVVVGTGPSLAAAIGDLSRVRRSVYLFTSPRGAQALREAGLVPDLVLIEHQTPLDAHFSLRDREHRTPIDPPSASGQPLVACDARTPAALVDGVAPDRLFVPDPLPTFGLWPSTAVALALAAGATDVRLLGIDLGTPQRPDPAQAPLRAMLALLAEHTTATCIDAGTTGARKRGWMPGSLAAGASGTVPPLALTTRPWPTREARLVEAAAAHARLARLVPAAEHALDAAERVRTGAASRDVLAALERALDTLLAWGHDLAIRVDVQDALGASFLPRYWRTPPDWTLGAQLWRPIALAAHEVLAQHAALGRRLAATGTAGPQSPNRPSLNRQQSTNRPVDRSTESR